MLFPAGVDNYRFTKIRNRLSAGVGIFLLILFFLGYLSLLGLIYLYPQIGTKGHTVFESRGQDWTFGQIVSLTVWCPVLLSLANNAIYGHIRGRTEQLPDSLKVVRVSTTLSSDEETGVEHSNAFTSSSAMHEHPTVVAIHERSNTVPIRRAGSNREENLQLERHVTFP
jgi:hypothetical protein